MFFSPEEWQFVLAAVDRLIPHDDEGPGALDLNVPVFIDRQLESGYGYATHWYMQGPFRAASPLFGYQSRLTPRELYRAGIRATNARCMRDFAGKRFAELAVAEQTDVLARLESGAIAFDEISSTDFFAFLLENTREGYLSDPIHGGNNAMGSWKMIGFPGARADFLDWVGTGKRYPYGPVSIDGQSGRHAYAARHETGSGRRRRRDGLDRVDHGYGPGRGRLDRGRPRARRESGHEP